MGVLAAGTQVVISSYQPRSWGWGISDNEVWSSQQTQITGHSCQAAVVLRSLQQTIDTSFCFHSFIQTVEIFASHKAKFSRSSFVENYHFIGR